MIGYGHEKVIHTVDVLNFSMDLPVVIDVVDTKEKVLGIVDEVEGLVEHGLVITHEVKMGENNSNNLCWCAAVTATPMVNQYEAKVSMVLTTCAFSRGDWGKSTGVHPSPLFEY
jgi:hypothetical protein